MKTFATLMPLSARRFGRASESRITGAKLSASEFLANLVRYGDFDEHLYYLAGEGEREDMRGAVEEIFGSDGPPARLEIRRQEQASGDLKDRGWDLLWAPLSCGAAIRARCPGSRFPTVWRNQGPVHDLISRRLVRDILYETKPYDMFLGTSDDHVASLRAMIGGTAARLGRAFGKEIAPPFRFEKIPHAVDIERFHPRNRLEAKRECGLPQDRFIVLLVGRLVVSDKMDVLPVLEGLRRLIAERPAVGGRFLFVLRGEQWWTNYGAVLRGEIERMDLGRHVRFEQEAFLPTLYSAADVFLAPSDGATENFGLTPVEAMACGTPAVVSDWNGYRETVVHGKTGFRFRTYGGRCDGRISLLWPIQDRTESMLYAAQSTALDVDEMFEHLVLLHDQPLLRDRLGRQAREHVERNYSWPAVIGRFCSLAREIIREAKLDSESALDPKPPVSSLLPAPQGGDPPSRTGAVLAPTALGRLLAAGPGALVPGPDGPRLVSGKELGRMLAELEGVSGQTGAPAELLADIGALVATGLLESVAVAG